MKSHQDKNISNESGLSSKLNQEPYNTSNENQENSKNTLPRDFCEIKANISNINRNNGMDEESTNSNERSKKHFNLFEEISSNLNNNQKPKELLDRLLSKMKNCELEEKNVPKRINELKMNIFFDNPQKCQKNNIDTLKKNNLVDIFRSTVDNKNVPKNLKTKINDMINSLINDGEDKTWTKRLEKKIPEATHDEKKEMKNKKERINEKKSEILGLLKGSRGQEIINYKGRNKSKILDKTENKDTVIMTKINSIIRSASNYNSDRNSSNTNNSNIKKVTVLSNKFENMFQTNQKDIDNYNDQTKFSKLYNAFNGI